MGSLAWRSKIAFFASGAFLSDGGGDFLAIVSWHLSTAVLTERSRGQEMWCVSSCGKALVDLDVRTLS